MDDQLPIVRGSSRARSKNADRDRAYVGRVLRLTNLPPDIIEGILRGNEPAGLSLGKLRKDLPVRWDEQRKGLGKVTLTDVLPGRIHSSA